MVAAGAAEQGTTRLPPGPKATVGLHCTSLGLTVPDTLYWFLIHYIGTQGFIIAAGEAETATVSMCGLGPRDHFVLAAALSPLTHSHLSVRARLQGFIMAAGEAEKGTVRICDLDPGQRLDTPWPVARQPQRATPTALGFYPEAQLHIVAVSRQVRMTRTQVTCSIAQPIAGDAAAFGSVPMCGRQSAGWFAWYRFQESFCWTSPVLALCPFRSSS